MKKLVRNTHRLKDFMRNDIWELDLDKLSKAKARFVNYLKVALITIRTFSSEKIGFQAVALSFFSTMAVVPFVAVVFAITDGFGLAEKLREFLYGYFNNSQQIIDTILGFAQNIITTAQSSTIGLVSALLFLWIVIWMMMNVTQSHQEALGHNCHAYCVSVRHPCLLCGLIRIFPCIELSRT